MINNKKPQGKEDVMNSVLNAATELFAEKGVAAVSIRDIAARANVNHGLIHRHFGSKENLRLQVQDRLMVQINRDIGDPQSFEEAISNGITALRKNKSFWKVMARTFLDEEFDGDVQSEFPFMKKMVSMITEAQNEGRLDTEIDPRYLVSGGFAMIFGLLVFNNYILPGTGLDSDSPEEVQDKIFKTLFSSILK